MRWLFKRSRSLPGPIRSAIDWTIGITVLSLIVAAVSSFGEANLWDSVGAALFGGLIGGPVIGLIQWWRWTYVPRHLGESLVEQMFRILGERRAAKKRWKPRLHGVARPSPSEPTSKLYIPKRGTRPKPGEESAIRRWDP